MRAKRLLAFGIAADIVIVGIVFLATRPRPPKVVDLIPRYAKGEVGRGQFTVAMTTTMTMPEASGWLLFPWSITRIPRAGASRQPEPSVPPHVTIMIATSATAEYRVLDVLPDGRVKMRITLSNALADSPQIPIESPPFGEQPVSYTMAIGKDGTMLSAVATSRGAPGFPSSATLSQLFVSAVPRKRVAVGDTWSEKESLPLGGNASVWSKLVSDAAIVEKQKAAKITSGVCGRVDLARYLQARFGKRASGLTGAMEVTGSAVTYFSPASGKLIKMEGTVRAATTVTIPPALRSPGSPSRATSVTWMNMTLTRL